jgi:hypothetical protein
VIAGLQGQAWSGAASTAMIDASHPLIDTAWSLQPAYSLIAQFHAVERFMLVADPGFEPG